MRDETVIPWIPSLPSSWAVQRAKTLVYRSKVLNSDRSERQVLSLTLRGVVDNDPENPEGLVPEDYATYQVFEPDDLVFKLIDLENVRTSRVGLVPKRGIMSSAYLRLRPRPGVCVRFLYWSFFDLYNRQIFNHLGSGVRSTLGAEDLLDLPLPVPPLATQRAIADYLDTETARIDALIAKKQRISALLAHRLAEVERSLTLDPIGSTVPLRWFVRVGSGDGIPASDVQDDPRLGSPVIGGNGLLGYTELVSRVDQPSIAVGRVGALCGNVHMVDPPAWITDNALWVRDIRQFDRAYLAAALRASNLNAVADRTAQPLITGETVKSLRLPLPSENEQGEVVGLLGAAETLTSDALERLERQIELLRERRQALITAAVTDELEVPGVAA